MSEKIHILMLEDVPEDAELIERELRKAGIVFDLVVVDTEEAFNRALDDFKPDVILADYSLPSFNCFSALMIAREKCPHVPVVVVTGSVGDELAVEMLKKGATDYILKGRLTRLAPSIDRALREAQVKYERKRAEESLRESERILKEAQRLGRIGHWEFDLKTQQISWSDMVFTLYERDPKLGPPATEEEAAYYSSEDAERLRNFAERAIKTGEPWEVDVSVKLPGERLMNCVSIGKPIKDARGQVIKIYGTIQDITERKQAEKRILNLNHMYAVLSDINKIIIKATDRDNLLREVCRIAVDIGKFNYSWIGILDQGEKTVIPFAHAGRGECPLLSRVHSLTCEPDLKGPVVSAIREKKCRVENDILSNHCIEPWWENVRACECRSLAAVSLFFKKQVLGVLIVCADEIDYFTEDEVKLLEEVGADLSFALDSLDEREQRQKAEKSLRESEELLRTVLINAPITIFATDSQAVFTLHEGKALQWIGMKPGENVGVSALDFYSSLPVIEYTGKVTTGEDVIHRVLGGETVSGITELRGTYFDNIFAPLMDMQGRVAGLIGVATDVSERERAEEALRASEKRYRSIFEMVPISIWEYDCSETLRIFEGLRGLGRDELDTYFERNPEVLDALVGSLRLLDVNRETLRMYGARTKEDIFREFGKHRLPETRQTFRKLAAAYLAGKSDLKIEAVNETLDGRRINIILQVTFSEEMKESGKALFTVINITDQENAERALRESEKKYRELAESLPQPVFETDISGKLTYANRKAFEQFGYSAKDFVRGICVFDVIAPQDYEQAKMNFAKMIQHIHADVQEYTARRKNGSTFPVSVYSTSVVHDNKVTGIRGFVIDLTERIRAETQLRQSQKMETVGQLAGGVAHDFNNILMAIMGFASFALRSLPEDNPAHKDILEVQKNSERAANLTKQLLAFSRCQRLEPKITDLNLIISDTAKMLRRLIGEHIELAILPDPNLWKVKVDPVQIEQVIINLTVNARDAMPRGGKLLISTANAELKDTPTAEVLIPRGSYVRVSVADSGMGMDEEVKSHLFEPFFTTKVPGKGTGLGLATCYGIIKQSGGYIIAESEPGKGSVFTIFLPRESEGLEPAGAPAAVVELLAGNETVLLAEDETSVRRMIARSLAIQGYRVLEALNGEEALRIIDSYGAGNIHLLLTDVVMPLMGGDELAARVRELRPDMKIMFMSGYTDDSLFPFRVDETLTQFIQKPVMPEELLVKIRRMLNGE